MGVGAPNWRTLEYFLGVAGTIRPRWIENEHPVLEVPADMQKNNTDKEIPLLPGFEDLLMGLPESERTGWVFEPASLQQKHARRPRHGRASADWVSRVISRIGKAAGVIVAEANEQTGHPKKYASAHDLRRSLAERLRNAGVPPLVICRVMRHTSWETTRKHYAPGNIQTDAAALRNVLNGEAGS
ncbi:MAG: hypothetical protein CMJ78_00660 [Planctomycetaceae bacterium]|nr:hypothetical protein [Planctomycetaceae bacterium]